MLSFDSNAKQPVTKEYISEMKVLAGKICATFENSILTTGTPIKDFEGILVNHIRNTTNKPPNRAEITRFLNQHKNYLICNKVGESHEAHHIYKRIVSVDLHRHLFYKYLLRDKNIDLNAIDMAAGKPETLLNYLDRVETLPKYQDQENFLKEVAKLKRRVSHPKYGGKRAKDLPSETLAHLHIKDNR